MNPMFLLDVPSLPIFIIGLAVNYWWISLIAALLVVSAIVGIVVFTKKKKKKLKNDSEAQK